MSAHVSEIPAKGPQSPAPPLVARTIEAARGHLHRLRRDGAAVVGLVPTMGSLHEGHLSLIRAARDGCDIVVVSIFVNPIQFGAGEDLDSYPMDIDADLELIASVGAGLVFAPAAAEVYPEGFETRVDVGSMAEGLCGQSRPGHFDGVATVVTKLFNIISPGKAYFGEKDAQQLAVIRRMARDLDFDVEINACPTVRDEGGLALSSRNAYMSPGEREQATVLYRALSQARDAVAAGETSASKLRRKMRQQIASQFLVEFEYARIVEPETLEPVDTVTGKVLAAVAAKVGPARLIDNMLIEPRVGE